MLLVAATVCLVCSLVVSTAAVLLRPHQLANQARERMQKVAAMLDGVPGLADLVGGMDVGALDVRVVELSTGAYAEAIDADAYDQRAAAADPERSVALPAGRDLAGLGRRARWATVYLARARDGAVRLVILPVHGQGFASMLYGYLALDADGATVRGLSFYEQGETPGLGAEVASPEWLATWRDKRVRDASGRLRVRVASGAAASEYEVDGIAGATWTGKGVTSLLHFWLGADGFGPFLERLAAEGERR
jgi:Na+-transporting NADH:ubiquinone oxidoreductase subunit C